ncbi:CGLAU_01105 family protein [Corynebacterium frankenforstense]
MTNPTDGPDRSNEPLDRIEKAARSLRGVISEFAGNLRGDDAGQSGRHAAETDSPGLVDRIKEASRRVSDALGEIHGVDDAKAAGSRLADEVEAYVSELTARLREAGDRTAESGRPAEARAAVTDAASALRDAVDGTLKRLRVGLDDASYGGVGERLTELRRRLDDILGGGTDGADDAAGASGTAGANDAAAGDTGTPDIIDGEVVDDGRTGN